MADPSATPSSTAPDPHLSLRSGLRLSPEVFFYAALIVLVLFTRFYDLDARVMSHDESLHTQFSWYLEQGRGFSHDPLMHGPLQMHLVAFSYFLFGDSDASARVPAALCGVLSVLMVLLFRRWLGKWGTAAAAALMAFSPYMLYYSRYVRNDVLVVPMALLMFYSVFRYVEDPRPRWLYLLAASLALHFAAKETAFIYTAQLLIFLGVLFAVRVLRKPWKLASQRWIFLSGLGVAGLGGAMTLGSLFSGWAASGEAAALEGSAASGVALSPLVPFGLLLGIGGVLLMVIALVLAFGRSLRTDFPVLDLIVFILTITIPQLAALPARIMGWDALDYSSITPLNRTIVLVVILIAISAAIGLLWNARKWLVAAGIFFGIFFVFYTTLFTNQTGIASGLVGSLGYWLKQHGVERGGQPWYYYLFIQIPIYEFLPAIGSLMAAFYLWRERGREPSPQAAGEERRFPVLPFLAFWSITALIAYSFAGEKMPWLTVHITLPMILFGGWAIGHFLSHVDWRALRQKHGWLVAIVLVLLLVAALRAAAILLGSNPPFQGKELDQLSATSGFLAALVFSLGAGFALWRLTADFSFSQMARGLGALVLFVLFGLTARASLRAAFPHADLATEYLVYAHGAPGVKTAMSQIEDISRRTTDGLALKIAFDDDVSWPLNWYLRHYTEQYFYGASPTRELLNYPVILVGDNNWGTVDPLLADDYYYFEYIRMWWPNQDYWSLKPASIEAQRNYELSAAGIEPTPMGLFEYLRLAWGHIAPFFTERAVRSAIFQIWLNRDFTEYGLVTGKDMRLDHWTPADRMRLYIRKDLAAELWDYGVGQAQSDVGPGDPYLDRLVELSADLVVGEEGVSPGEFYLPRDAAVGQDGELYVADTGNHRIERFTADGELISTWGGYANAAEGEAPGGTFNEPWGLAVAPNGDVYVADTWNHRVQWFSPDGDFKGMFGSEGLGQDSFSFWGPRDVAVDSQGRVYVADTGNKLVKVFSAEGEYLAQFGGAGYLPGQLDEPVGLAVGAFDRVYVADTWNHRVQVFQELNPNQYDLVAAWDVEAWFGQSLDNKPYLAVDPDGQVCLTDPEGLRVLCFSGTGEFLYGWGGGLGSAQDQFALLSGIAFSPQGEVWVVDTGNQRVMRFPQPGSTE